MNTVISSSAALAAPLSTETAQAASTANQAAAADFPVRALEIHSTRMWRWKSVENAFQVMERLGLNTLIYHHHDQPDQLGRPRAYLSSEVMFARWPVRAHTIDNNKQYIRRAIREASRRKIRFFLEVKETVTTETQGDRTPPERYFVISVALGAESEPSNGLPRSPRCHPPWEPLKG